ncbi:hypothetical protein FHW88_003212 [Mucilaginibacter sp. SG538B]|uniref:peptidoglycan-binding domain-containing protein n=1 Tax=Mucilaginibacter sp. SG538B TaxID=2587021 RepID=UPI00159DF28F|nr:peptidoglycan-binding protein [Mucilaginibacter sp. SG538B]NVM64923.1 hypothetical protein [Mucilaginibacter sp. SG538B]
MADTQPDESFNKFKSQIKTELDFEVFKYYQEEQSKRSENKWLKSQYAPIILSAIFALLGIGVGAWIQGVANRNLEKQKFEADLVLKMIETNGDQQAAAQNLNFLVQTGLVNDDSLRVKLSKIIKHPGEVPSLGDLSADRKIDLLTETQKQLKSLGYYAGPIDGQESDIFRKAVMAFQEHCKLIPDGMLGAKTLQQLSTASK